MDIKELQDAAIQAATEHIKDQRQENRFTKAKLVCTTIVACVLLVCAAAVACYAIYAQQRTIIEQQYALNMQYASLMEYVVGAEVTTETAETGEGDNGTAFVGDGNTVIGGDLNG